MFSGVDWVKLFIRTRYYYFFRLTGFEYINFFMDLQRLNKGELQYELRVRGVKDLTGETVVSMRIKLKELMRDESFGEVAFEESFKPELDKELSICIAKVAELDNYVKNQVVISLHSNESRYIDTKLRHLFSRLERLKSEDKAFNKNVHELVVKLNQIESAFDDKLSKDDSKPEHVTLPSNLVHRDDSGPSDVASPALGLPRQRIPVHKWDISFSGDRGSLSVNAFLERLDELRVSRGVSTEDLKDSVVELLRGSALVWYRSVRDRLRSWADFVEQLRRDFLPCDYEHDLWAEIRARRQGANERVSEYVAAMLNLFNRLPRVPAEEEKLAILRRNVAPYYIHGLGLQEIGTVEELVQGCRRLEAAKEMASRSRSVLSRTSYLEPDLAYVDPRASGSKGHEVNSICWNCEAEGHTFSRCSKPKNKLFCYRCGKQGVTKFQCECNSKNGLQGRRFTGRRS